MLSSYLYATYAIMLGYQARVINFYITSMTVIYVMTSLWRDYAIFEFWLFTDCY